MTLKELKKLIDKAYERHGDMEIFIPSEGRCKPVKEVNSGFFEDNYHCFCGYLLDFKHDTI